MKITIGWSIQPGHRLLAHNKRERYGQRASGFRFRGGAELWYRRSAVGAALAEVGILLRTPVHDVARRHGETRDRGGRRSRIFGGGWGAVVAGAWAPWGSRLAAIVALLAMLVACGVLEETAAPASIENPVYAEDFPDPYVLPVDGTYYAYATNAQDANVPTLRSLNLVDWTSVGDALPALPDWAATYGSYTWAPAVLEREGGFVLYHTTRLAEAGRQCISHAVSDAPEGPFRDASDAPLICQLELGGSIDPSPFVDADGSAYLLWKQDGNCCGYLVAIWVQPLGDDGLTLTGAPVELIRYDQPWEVPLVEGPAMVEHEADYYLFYSAGRWDTADYAIGYALCESVTGPCEKPLDGPLFEAQGDMLGPGGQAFFRDATDRLWMAYHAWTVPEVGYPAGERALHLAPVTFESGRPIISAQEDH